MKPLTERVGSGPQATFVCRRGFHQSRFDDLRRRMPRSQVLSNNTSMKFSRLVLIGAVAAVAGASPVSAQSVEGNRAGIARTNLISSNPIGLLFEWYQAEFEHAISPTVSLAVAGSSYEFLDDETVASVDAIVRYYPSARAVRGFSLGVSGGFVGVEEDFCDAFGTPCTRDDYTAFTLGIRGDYVWLLGRDQNLAVAAGIGAKRLLADRVDGIEGLPVGRLSIGYAF